MSDSFIDTKLTKEQILKDYSLGWLSRSLSIIGRKEVLSGKAKFGIFGDGKEVAQLALSHFMQNGDWRSGYYRDQTLALATGMVSLEEFFHQLYGTPDINFNPSTGGRSFNNHYGSRLLDENGDWLNQLTQRNTTSDISPTAGQMPRSIGLALASKLYRNSNTTSENSIFSNNGNEVVFTTIGDASTSEGHFFEIMNAVGVKQVPLAVFVWDDGYGISVEKEKQTIKGSISEALRGFEKSENSNGIKIYKAKGWDYPNLLKVFSEGIKECREKHVPILFHIDEITQPQGHSTSGSHERYKSAERLDWEKQFDGLLKMKEWILENNIASESELDEIEKQALIEVKEALKNAWAAFQAPILKQKNEIIRILENKKCVCSEINENRTSALTQSLRLKTQPSRKDLTSTARRIIRNICSKCSQRSGIQKELSSWLGNNRLKNFEKYSAHLYSENQYSVLHQKKVAPEYNEDSEEVAGRVILRDNFDYLFNKYPEMIVFGEDVGVIGGVNQTYEGLQEKYGEHRIFDTGIREASIIGKGIGLALRGFRPIAEIQYLDYLLYGLQTLSDDLATLHWRTVAGQAAPLIISSRGHRLEGIWHAGSPIGMILSALRGIYICAPRNLTQAAGMYNTLLNGRDPALVIEPLNGYRLKEKTPSNIGEFFVPLGHPEILNSGDDITIVTYGSSVKIAIEAVKHLKEFEINAELIDIQTLLPFDINEVIVQSLQKTKKVVFFDEDVPGGTTAYMMQKVLEEQNGFQYLAVPPRTLSAREHRPAYTSDGDYYSNPNAEDLFELVYSMFSQIEPNKYPPLY